MSKVLTALGNTFGVGYDRLSLVCLKYCYYHNIHAMNLFMLFSKISVSHP